MNFHRDELQERQLDHERAMQSLQRQIETLLEELERLRTQNSNLKALLLSLEAQTSNQDQELRELREKYVQDTLILYRTYVVTTLPLHAACCSIGWPRWSCSRRTGTENYKSLPHKKSAWRTKIFGWRRIINS